MGPSKNPDDFSDTALDFATVGEDTIIIAVVEGLQLWGGCGFNSTNQTRTCTKRE